MLVNHKTVFMTFRVLFMPDLGLFYSFLDITNTHKKGNWKYKYIFSGLLSVLIDQ